MPAKAWIQAFQGFLIEEGAMRHITLALVLILSLPSSGLSVR
jgi:hypothetical protein